MNHHSPLVEWIITILSLIGSWLNAHQRTSAFTTWGVANTVGAIYFLWTGQYAFVVLQIAFFGTNAIGYRNSIRRDELIKKDIQDKIIRHPDSKS